MRRLSSLDTHAHLDPARSAKELARAEAVLAMTSSLEEATCAVGRQDPKIAWGIGCHPRSVRAQETFNLKQFRNLVKRTAIVGEIGLDASSRVPLQIQLRTFRQILEVVADRPDW